MRVIVTGSRLYTNRTQVYTVLDQLDITHIATGAAAGADSLARDWAAERKINYTAFPVPDEVWKTVGNKAGSERNARMLLEFAPDLVVAFPGGRGTRDMMAKAKRAKVRVLEIES